MTTAVFERRTAGSMPRRCVLATAFFCIAFGLLSALQSPAAHGQTYTVLQAFNGADGAYPNGSLTLNGSTLYGMTSSGGTSGNGNIFSISTSGGDLQSLYSFSGGADGAYPNGSLTLSGSTLYGMTVYGGGFGNILSINTNGGGFQGLYTFSGGTDGVNPWGSLTLIGPTLYGMTYGGGTSGNGNLFSFNTSGGSLQSVLSFSGSGGANPGAAPFGSLTSSGSTLLYGMTCAGGASGNGNVFSVNTDGSGFRNLLSFSGSGGANPGQYPDGDLTLSGSTLYGMTWSGGTSGKGNVFSVNTDGTGFHNLFSFSGADGANPNGDLILSGSTLFGMTEAGGSSNDGTIFSINTDGTGFQSLLSFSGSDGAYAGANPYGSLTLSGSILYGMTSSGGGNNDGVVFSLAIATVPEPSTFVLLSIAAMGLAGCTWRSRRRS
ncbi:MAG: choice-of-anchor tandem repeat GloVer-containing protein [Thermoguttaceae bacterium]